jgi:hypothetical protein
MLLGQPASRMRRAPPHKKGGRNSSVMKKAMKKESPKEEPSDEMASQQPEEGREEEKSEGRSGEGAHSAMKHWLHEERNRIKRHEH